MIACLWGFDVGFGVVVGFGWFLFFGWGLGVMFLLFFEGFDGFGGLRLGW